MSNSEQALISSILRNGDLPVALKMGVNKSMFHIHSDEYAWIENYYLKRSRTPQKAAFRTAFPDFQIKVVDETDHFSDEVKHDHMLRSIDRAVQEVLNLTDIGDGDAALNMLHSSAMRISSEMGLVVDGDVFTDNDDILKEFAERKERYETTGSAGIPSGFPTFDARTGGYGPGEHSLICAITGRGKSFYMQRCAAHAALSGYKVQYNALEQPRANVMARVISLISKRYGGQIFNSRNLLQGKDYDAKEFLRFMGQIRNEVSGRLHVADGSGGKITVASIAAQIERNKPDIVFVDHITLMGGARDWQAIGDISDQLTRLSLKYAIPINSGAQLNRTGKQNDSGPESIGEAYKIAQDASGMIVIRPMTTRVNFNEQVKGRNSGNGWGFWTRFDPDNGIYDEVPHAIAQELMAEDEIAAREGVLDNE